MAESSGFFTQAGNFGSAMTGGVDPRTGLFHFGVELGRLVGNRNLGPSLPLVLSYSPLSRADMGFGPGFSLGLTSYDTGSGQLLALSTGEQYKVESISGNLLLRQKKLDTVHFSQTDDSYRVVHKSGDVEILNGPGRGPKVKVPTDLLGPSGHSLTLDWDFTVSPFPRLNSIADEDGKLLSVDYGDGSTVTLSILPEHDEGYEVKLQIEAKRLVGVSHLGLSKPLNWTFGYTALGAWGSWITKVTTPGGLSETVSYQKGHNFPDSAPSYPPLPYVKTFVQNPGAGQPQVTAKYEYSSHNFLGGGTQIPWNQDEDYLYSVLNGYTYSSTETRSCGNQTTTITRTYNSYHLLTGETTKTEEAGPGSFTRDVENGYYAKPNTEFKDQPAIFQLPTKRTVTWTGPDGTQHHEITQTDFDPYGNLVKKTDPDKRVTQWAYYPADGSESGGPKEPNGFTRLMKSTTRTPAPGTGFDAPTYTTTYRYISLDGTRDPRVAGVVMKSDAQTSADGQLQKETTVAYDTTPTSPEFGRITTLTENEYPDDGRGAPYTTTHTYSYQADTDTLTRTHTLTSHDQLTLTHSHTGSRFSGTLRSATDPRGNVTKRTSDALGRTLTHTVSADDQVYQATKTFEHDMGDVKSAPFTVTTTDAIGNQLYDTFDGAGRFMLRQRLDLDDGGTAWYTVQQHGYDEQGRLAWASELDSARSSGIFTLTRTFAYDGWGQLLTTTSSDGACHLTRTDPVSLTITTQLQDSSGQAVTGTVVTTHNLQGKPVKVQRFDKQNNAAGTRTLDRDGWGRLRQETDERGNTTRYDYDSRGRLVTTVLPDKTTIKRIYAQFTSDALVTALAVDGQTYGTQSFDGLGRLTGTTSGKRTWSYHYATPDAPAPDTVTTPDGQTRTYTYVSQLDNAVSQVATEKQTITQSFQYEPLSGSLKQASETESGSDVDTIDRTYFPSGLLKTETTKVFGQNPAIATWAYTVGGLPQSYAGVDGATQSTARDTFGRVSTVDDPAMQAALTYDTAGRLTQWATKDKLSGRSLTTVLALDDFGREVKRTVTDSQGTVWTLEQTWLANDLLAGRTLTRDSTQLRKETYAYSNRNQLQVYTCDGDAAPVGEQGKKISRQDFKCDKYGNITECVTKFADNTTDTATYAYSSDDPCRLISITRSSTPVRDLSYDAAGRLTKDDAGWTLIYDDLGRLAVSRGTLSSGYRYDPLDRLTAQTVTGVTTALYYRDTQLANVITGGDNPASTRLLPLGQGCVAQHETHSNETRLLGTDSQRTALITATGQDPGEVSAYTPYGYRPAGTSSTLGYTGERQDPATGWYHLGNGYRPYRPELMRFTAPDSLSPFDAGGINPYTYCHGDPVNHTDPTGHLAAADWAAIAFGIVDLVVAITSLGAALPEEAAIATAEFGAVQGMKTMGKEYGRKALAELGKLAAANLIGYTSSFAENLTSSQKTKDVLGWIALGITTVATLGVGAMNYQTITKWNGLRKEADNMFSIWKEERLSIEKVMAEGAPLSLAETEGGPGFIQRQNLKGTDLREELKNQVKVVKARMKLGKTQDFQMQTIDPNGEFGPLTKAHTSLGARNFVNSTAEVAQVPGRPTVALSHQALPLPAVLRVSVLSTPEVEMVEFDREVRFVRLR
ncbi:RHS repeat-associated core domain-containing protein [Streptomyces rimosus]|uniref:RHS repeat-associated core domain-containing protein n=1 Tax=Streptomyces rimosus TaxID=1927 RepID=UPI0031D0DB25